MDFLAIIPHQSKAHFLVIHLQHLLQPLEASLSLVLLLLNNSKPLIRVSLVRINQLPLADFLEIKQRLQLQVAHFLVEQSHLVLSLEMYLQLLPHKKGFSETNHQKHLLREMDYSEIHQKKHLHKVDYLANLQLPQLKVTHSLAIKQLQPQPKVVVSLAHQLRLKEEVSSVNQNQLSLEPNLQPQEVVSSELSQHREASFQTPVPSLEILRETFLRKMMLL